MSVFEDFVNDELPRRIGMGAASSPSANNYLRATGVGKVVEQRTPAQVLSDIVGAAAVHTHVESDITDLSHYTHPNHTGDVTSVGDGAQTIANDAVTYAKMQNVSATDRFLGRDTAGAGDVEEIAAVAARTILNVEDNADVTDATNVDAAGAMMESDNRYRRFTKLIYIEDPKATDSFPFANVPFAATCISVVAVTDVGTVTFNIEKRSKLTPDVAGTDIWTVDKVATAAGIEETSFDSGAISADQWMNFAASAVSSGPAPAKLWVFLEYSVNI